MKKSLHIFFIWLVLNSCLAAAPPDPNDPKYDWMDTLVEKDFEWFKDGITLEMINATQANWKDRHLRRAKVSNNQVTGEGRAAFEMLSYLAHTYGLPDLDMLYYEEDGIKEYAKGGAPIFCSSKVKSVHQAIYFVDWYTVISNPRWDNIAAKINQMLKEISWKEMKNQLIWRGRQTDGLYNDSNWQTAGRRGRLVHFSHLHPDLIDACFISADWTRVDLNNRPENFMTHEEQVIYKYQIILDGIFTTYPGDRWRLLSHSVVFMHESEKGHWFYDALIPWFHYVPVKSDLSDLVEKLTFIMENDEMAQEIAANARNFALNYLLSEHIAVYCYKALLKYASLFQRSESQS